MGEPSITFPDYPYLVDLSLPTLPDVLNVLGTFTAVDGLEVRLGGLHTTGDVTFKRGLVGSAMFVSWRGSAQSTGPFSLRNLQVTQRGTANATIAIWRLIEVTLKVIRAEPPSPTSQILAVDEIVLTPRRIEQIEPRPLHFPNPVR